MIGIFCNFVHIFLVNPNLIYGVYILGPEYKTLNNTSLWSQWPVKEQTRGDIQADFFNTVHYFGEQKRSIFSSFKGEENTGYGNVEFTFPGSSAKKDWQAYLLKFLIM